MPYTMCPHCANISHLSVGDVKSWHEERHPGIPLGTLIPNCCYYCVMELHEGDIVVIRTHLLTREGVQLGDRGVVEHVWTSTGGSLFQVRLNNGRESTFIRAEIRGLIGKEKSE